MAFVVIAIVVMLAVLPVVARPFVLTTTVACGNRRQTEGTNEYGSSNWTHVFLLQDPE
jgi:hypothetical protein